MMRRILWAVAALAVVGVASRYLPLEFLRPEIERALDRGLGRKVDVDAVYVNLFGAPGFTLEGVTIHEDPRAGAEPFAYVDSLDAGIRWLSLFRRRLEFSSLDLGDATVNLVKTAEGPWNFQFLLGGSAAGGRALPAIKIRGGRVNFKFGDTKSVFFFDNADFDVTPYGKGAVELRFGGAPSRTDRPAQDFGLFFVRGNWNPSGGPRLDLSVELERSSLDEISRFIDPRGFGLHGVIALQAQLSGAPSQLQVSGQLQVDDVHRWDLLPQRGGWSLPFQGRLDLRAEKLDLASVEAPSGSPVGLQFRAWDFLSNASWEAGAHLSRVPLAALVEVARHMGARFPENLSTGGNVSGAVTYTQDAGLAGQAELRDASLTLPEAEPLRAAAATVSIADGAMYLEKSTVEIGERQSAEIEAAYTLRAPRELDLRIATRGLNTADMRPFGVAAIPLLDQARQGTWRGAVRYHAGEWSGDYELQNARIAVDGLADPVRIQSASVKLASTSVSVTKLRARAGSVAFTGDYRWEPDALRPHKFNLTVPEADVAELERLLTPSLVRERGFLARTLRLAPAPAPAWLKSRRADGTLSIGALSVGDVNMHLERARLLWDGESVRLVGINAAIGAASASGDLEISLEGRAPHYHFDGRLQDVAYKGGKLDFEGSLEADGTSDDIPDTLRAEGALRGRSIAFASEAEFRSAAACFQLQGARWKLSEVEVVQGADTFLGSGASQPDGKLVLDLTKGTRQIRFAALLGN